MPYVPATQETAATSLANALAVQAGNYARAVKAGIPHDMGEARSMLRQAQNLVNVLEGKDISGEDLR